MSPFKFRIIPITVLVFFISVASFSQHKTGNIVEYFGKEKINEISEGKLLHVFKTGLSVKIQNFSFNSSSFPKDPVFKRFLMNSNLKVSKGEVFDINSSGDELKWQEIVTDETNTFNDQNLRSSYVYLTYKSGYEQTVLFDDSVLTEGDAKVKCAGFFGNDWSIEKGEFKWN